MEIFEGKGQSEHGKKVVQKYKEKIIGKTALDTVPSRYSQIGAVHDMGIDPKVWDTKYTMHDKAELMARRFIKNMVEIIDATYREEDESRERQERERNKNKGSGKASHALKNDSED